MVNNMANVTVTGIIGPTAPVTLGAVVNTNKSKTDALAACNGNPALAATKQTGVKLADINDEIDSLSAASVALVT
jgi:hypothetical protein